MTVLLRLAGAGARGSAAGLARPLGWLLSACAAWLAVAVAGGFAPVGLALLVGVLFSLLDRGTAGRALRPDGAERAQDRGRRWRASVLGDIAVVGACGYVSIPALTPAVASATAAAVVVVGGLIDLAVSPRSGRLRTFFLLLPLLLWLGYGVAFPRRHAVFRSDTWPQIRSALGPFFAVGRTDPGMAVELETGTIAWLTLPPGPPPYRPALFFHGADEEGAYQRGALFLRRALVNMGFAVLALDERGFGASPPPADLRQVEGWDPEPSSLAAARYLRALPGVRGSVLAVGHSMGATRALRFVDQWVLASGAVVLGATVMPPTADDERLYRRFLLDLNLEGSGLTRDLVLDIRRRYFNNNAAASSLSEGHAPVLFVRFSFEYQNIIRGRNALYAMIPGRKAQWELRTDHQFATSRVHGVLTGDWRVMRDFEVGLSRFLEGRSPRTGEPLPYAPRR